MRQRKTKTSSSEPADNWPVYVDKGVQKPSVSAPQPLAQGQLASHEETSAVGNASQSSLEIVGNSGRRLVVLMPGEIREITRALKRTLDESNHFLDLLKAEKVRYM